MDWILVVKMVHCSVVTKVEMMEGGMVGWKDVRMDWILVVKMVYF